MKGLETARQLAAQVRPSQTPVATGRAPRLTIEKMRRALPEFQDTSDRDLVELWSQANGRDFGELADEVGLPTSSTLGEMGGQFGQGLRVDTPRMVGQALQYFSGGDNQFAQRMIEGAERRGLTAQQDPRGRGAIANDALIAGARGLGPVAATLATSVIPYAGQVIAPALAAATFGGSGAYETYQRVFDETGDAAAASAAARRVGVLQGGGEAIATMAGGALIRPAVAAIRGAPTTARVVDALTDTRVLRPAAVGIAKNTAVQVGTEIGQDVGTSMIESAYGAQDEDLGQIAYQSGMAAAGMSLLLGGFGVGGYRARARQADRIQKALDGDPSVAPEDRARILGVVNQEAERRGVSMTDRETWVREQLLPAEQRKNETLDRMEQIRAEIALTDRDNTQGREKLVAEFRSLYDAPSGERAPAEDGTEVVLTNGQLMAREITAMRERQRTEQQAQKDPNAEIDITQAPAQEDFKVNTDTLFASFIDEQSLPTLEQLQNTDVTTMAPEVRNEFEAALRMASRPTMSVKNRAVQLRRAVDILETASPADANAMGMGWVIPREGVSTLAAPPALTEQEQAATQMGRQQQALESIDLLDTDIEAQETPPFVTRGQAQAFDQVQQQQPVEDETLTGAPRITAMTPEAETQMDRQRAALRDIEQTQPTNTPTVAQMEQQEQGRLRGAFDQVMQRSQDLDTQEVVQAQRRFPVPAGQVETGTPTPPAQQIAPAQDRMFSRASEAELERVIAAEDTVPYRRRMARAELERRQPAPVEPAPVVAAQRAPDAEQKVPAEPIADADIEIDTEEELEQIDTLVKNLDAEVEGADAPKSTGRVSLPKAVLIAIRNAILNPNKKGQTVVRVPGTTAIDEATTAQYQSRIAKIARAANKFADSYDAIITKARNLVSDKDKEFRDDEQLMSEVNAILRVGADAGVEFAMYDEIRNASPAAQAWFKRRVKGVSLKDLIDQHEAAKKALIDEFGTDTKNIDAIVRMVKDRAQARLNKGSVDSATYKRLRKIDLTLSRGWNAARRGVDTTEQLFDVRANPTRAAKEARDQRGPLVMALEGVNAKGKESGPGGIVGVMDYYVKNGTVYEKTLARAIRAVVINMGDNAPTMKLKAGDKPRYNPATNTIHIGTDASPSVILHEALHGALQWYVYNNQNSPQVAQLIKAVEQVVAYNGNLSAKAQEVQNVLKKLMSGKNPRVLDAVLELVSYGNTLNEFRTALDQMPTIGTPLTFRENVEKVWRSILNVVNTMLGVKPNATLANDVIKNTFMLLESAASFKIDNAMDAGRRKGVLKSEVSGADDAQAEVHLGNLSKLLGAKLYAGSMPKIGMISIKEVFQNSHDAIKDAIKAGSKNGNISIDVNEKMRTITITDDGVGMTRDIIRDAFLTIAGSQKDTDRGSGGLGIAKMLFLYGNKSISLRTVRDGVESVLQTTGPELLAAREEGAIKPKIYWEKTDKPSGTTLTLEIPDSYIDERGAPQTINFPSNYSIRDELEKSPLFENTIVKFNGGTLDVGANFPQDKYTPLFNVPFSWGKVSIIVKPDKYVSNKNVTILSNGIYQFDERITRKSGDPYSPPVPFRFFFNFEPSVKATDLMYPFELNRQGFMYHAEKDFDAVKKYINVLYANKLDKEGADSFGELTQIGNGGNTVLPISLKIPDAEQGSVFEIKRDDKLEVRDGRLFINGRVTPELTRETMEKLQRDPGKFRVDQSLLDPAMAVVHDNITLDGKDFIAQLKDYVGEKAYNDFVYGFGEVFKSLRDATARIAGTAYNDIVDVPVGISYDIKYYGVSTAVPFKGMMINPLFWRSSDRDVSSPTNDIIGTMIHEIAHHTERNHSTTGFIPEMQRLFMVLGMSGDMQIAKAALDRLYTKHDNVIEFFKDIHADTDTRVKSKGERLQDANDYSDIADTVGELSEAGASSQYAGRTAGPSRATRDGEDATGVRASATARDGDRIQSEKSSGTPEAAGPRVELIPLRELSDPMAAGRQEGKTLYATVTGTDLPARDADASTGQYQRAMPQRDYEKFNKKILPAWMSSKFLFDSYGGWWGKTMKAIDEKGLSRLSAHIQETSPRLTTVIKWVNNNYGLQGAVADLMLRAKDDRRGGSIQVEVLADHLASLPTEMTRKVLASLDGRLEALRKGEVLPPIEGIDRKTGIDLLANDMLDRWWEYARTTRDERLRDRLAGVYNPKTKQWEGGAKFSQGLVIPDIGKNIVSPTFGEQALTKFTKMRTKTEQNEDAIMMRTDSNGDPVLTDKFIGLYKLDAEYQQARKDGVPMAELQPHEFISVERFLAGERPTSNGVPMDFDNAYLWTLERKGNKGYKMSAQLDLSSVAAAKSSQQIAGALKNTMAIMASSYSATRLTDSLYAHGRGTPNAVAYDSLDELNSVLQGKYVNGKFELQPKRSEWKNQIRKNNVLEGRERGADAVRDRFNTSNSWIRVPSKSTYGALAGKIVQGSVWNTLQDTYDTRPVITLRQANTIMRWFKKAKTQYNPATWGTNVATNFTMAMLDDIPMQTIATASRLYFGYMLPENVKKALGVDINLTREEQELFAGILGTNAMIGTVSTAELRQDVFEAMRDSFGGPEMSLPSRIMQFMNMEKKKLQAFEKRYGAGKTYVGDRTEAFDKFMSDWYAAQDNVFRVASMLNKLGQMKSEGRVIDAEAFRIAGDHARFAFLDYDIDSKAVKIMRQTAFPFISWPYAAAKLIGHVAIHKPWKLVNLYAGYWMLDALLQTITGDDEEELRKAGPEWARDRLFFGMGPHTHLRVPFLGDDENPVYYNLGKYIAPSSFGETVPNPFLGVDGWPSFINPGGPFISAALIITAGVDPFTGDKISPPTASGWENAAERLKMTQGLFMPNLPVPFLIPREYDKAVEAFTARTDRSENYDDLYLARLAGLRFYDFNVDGARQAQSRAAQAIRRDFDVQISRLRRSMLRHETPDYDKFIREREKLRARLDERLAELTGDDNNL